MPAKKAQTLIALIRGSSKIPSSPEKTMIVEELFEVSRLASLTPLPRRCLFQLIHAMRAFDSSLAAIAVHHHISPAHPSMGKYLSAFRDETKLPFTETDRLYYQKLLVNRRNDLVHKAGCYPAGRHDVIRLIDAMCGCISRVL
jgi:hypothetical protein